MKKFFKRTFSVIGYALVYILLSLGTAVGIIFLSPVASNSPEDDIYIAPQISHIYSNFTTVKALQIDVDALIETPTSQFNIFLKANLDLGDGFENLEFDGTISVAINDEMLNIDVSYTNGVAYVEVLNGKYKIQTNDIGEAIGQIMSVLNIEMPDLGGFNLANLDPNAILAMLSDLTETKGEDSITLIVNVPVIGSLEILCDLNYSIKELMLPKTTISEGTSIAFSSSLAYPTSITIEEPPANEYIEATYLFNVLGATLEYVNQDNIGFNLDVNYNNLSLQGDFSADMKDLSAKFEIDVFGTPLKLIAQDNTFFVEYGNVLFKFALEDAPLLTNLLNEQFGLNIPIDTVATILSALKNGNLFDIIGGLDLGETKEPTRLSDIDLSIIQNFVKEGNDYILTLRDIGNITFTVNENNLSALGFVGFGVDAKITTKTPQAINLATSQEAYIDLADILPTINATINTIKLDNYVGNIAVTNNEDVIGNIYFAITKQDANPKAHLEAVLYGQTINIDYADGYIFLQVKDIKLYTTLEDIDTITTFLKDTLGFSIEGFNINEFVKQIQNIVNPAINPVFIKELKQIDNGLTITLFNDLKATITFFDTLNGLNIEFENLSINIDIIASQNEISLPTINKAEYEPITKVLDIVTSVKEYIENKQFYLGFNLKYQTYEVVGSVNYDENGISVFAETMIDNVNIQLKFVDDVVYAELADLKFSFALSDIDTVIKFVYDEFGIDLNKMLSDLMESVKGIENNTQDFDFEQFLTELNVVFSDNLLEIVVPNFNVKVNFANNKLTGASVETSDINLDITFNNIASTIELNGTYFNISEILPFIATVKNYVETKQFNIVANAQVYEKKDIIYNANVTLQMDFVNKFQFYGKADLTGKQDMDIEASLYEDYLYMAYNGLLLKMDSNSLNELLVIIMNMFGIDPSLLPFLQDVTNGMDIDFDSLKGLGSGLDFDSPLTILTYFKSISVNGNTLEILLDGSKISSNERAENMQIKLVTDGKNLVSLQMKNLYTGVSNDEHFDLDIQFNEFDGITTPDTTKNYVDISGANELIKAIINMTEYSDFEITGNLNIDMSIPVLSDLHIVVPVNFKVKIVDGKPEMFIAIEKIPVVHPLVYNLNNDTKWSYSQVNTLNIATMKSSGETRNLYIYYKDGEVYFYRHELNSKGASYEKKLKAPMETVMSDILYYVQWGTGFNDDVIDAIRKSLANEHDIDLGNIIRSFTPSENGYTIVLNMTEISGDKNMGDMTINLGLVDHTSTVNGENVTKKVIGLIDFKMNMPFTDSLQLNMQTAQDDPLTLVNLGQTIDFTDFYNFIDNYEFEDNMEMERYNNEAWTKATERQFTVSFVTNQDFTVENVSGVQGTTFSLPIYTDYEKTNETDRDLFHFVGWYTSSNFTSGTEFTEGIIPRNNVTLFAKWDTIESYRTVEFYVDNVLIASQYDLVGSPLKQLNFTKLYDTEIGNQKLTMQFVGWVDDEGYSITYIPEYSDKLYAKFEVINTVTKYTLSFETGVGENKLPVEIYNYYSAENVLNQYDTSDVYVNKDGVTTTYQFAGWYLDSTFTTPFDNIMPENDLTIYAKWDIVNVTYERAINIYDNETLVYSDRYVVGDTITLPQNVKIDNNTLWYEDSSYLVQTTLPEIMPDSDVNLHIRNKYSVSYTYYENVNGVHTQRTFSDNLYQGETITLPTLSDYEISYDNNNDGDKDELVAYKFNGFEYNGEHYNNSITVDNQNMEIVADPTIEREEWCKMTFHFEWVKPQNSPNTWTNKQVHTQIDPIFVLKGATLNGIVLTYKTSLLDDTQYTTELSASCSGKMVITYNYHAIGYNNTGCVNYGSTKGTPKNMEITKSDDFYVEWDD